MEKFTAKEVTALKKHAHTFTHDAPEAPEYEADLVDVPTFSWLDGTGALFFGQKLGEGSYQICCHEGYSFGSYSDEITEEFFTKCAMELSWFYHAEWLRGAEAGRGSLKELNQEAHLQNEEEIRRVRDYLTSIYPLVYTAEQIKVRDAAGIDMVE